MPEMAHTGEHHRDAVSVAYVDEVLIVARAAGLDDSGYAGLSRSLGAVIEREERVGTQRSALYALAGALYRHLGGPYAVGLARAYAQRLAVDVYKRQGVRFNARVGFYRRFSLEQLILLA